MKEKEEEENCITWKRCEFTIFSNNQNLPVSEVVENYLSKLKKSGNHVAELGGILLHYDKIQSDDSMVNKYPNVNRLIKITGDFQVLDLKEGRILKTEVLNIYKDGAFCQNRYKYKIIVQSIAAHVLSKLQVGRDILVKINKVCYPASGDDFSPLIIGEFYKIVQNPDVEINVAPRLTRNASKRINQTCDRLGKSNSQDTNITTPQTNQDSNDSGDPCSSNHNENNICQDIQPNNEIVDASEQQETQQDLVGTGSNDKTNIKNSKKDSTNKENQNPNIAEYQVSNVELLPGFICELIPPGRKHYFDSKGNKFNTFRKAQEAFVAGEKSQGKLPPGFHTKTQKSGKKYYLNENNLRFTNVASCWDDFNKKCASATSISAKGKLPPGFKAITRPSGKKYYINEANMKFFNIPSCWEAFNNIASVDKSQDSAPNRPENSSNILLPKSSQANIGDNESASATNPIKVTARKLKGNITNKLSAAQIESTINQKEPLSVEKNTNINRQESLAIQKPTGSRNALLAAQNKPDLENDYSSSDEDFDIPKQPSTRKNKCTTQNKVIVKNARHNASIKDLIPRTLSPQDLRSDSSSSSINDDIRDNVDCVKASNNESSSSSDSDDCPILMKMSKKDRQSVEMIDSSSSSSSEDESIKSQQQNMIYVKRKMRYHVSNSSSSSSDSSSLSDDQQERRKPRGATKINQNKISSSDSSSSDSEGSKDGNVKQKYRLIYVRSAKNLGHCKKVRSTTNSGSDDKSSDFVVLTVKNKKQDTQSSESCDSSDNTNYCANFNRKNKRKSTRSSDSNDSPDKGNHVGLSVKNKDLNARSSDSSDSEDEINHDVDVPVKNKNVDTSSGSYSSVESDQKKDFIRDVKDKDIVSSSSDVYEDTNTCINNANEDASNKVENMSDTEDLILSLEDDEIAPEQLITETSEIGNNNTVPEINITTSQSETGNQTDDTRNLAVTNDEATSDYTTAPSEEVEFSDKASITTLDTDAGNVEDEPPLKIIRTKLPPRFHSVSIDGKVLYYHELNVDKVFLDLTSAWDFYEEMQVLNDEESPLKDYDGDVSNEALDNSEISEEMKQSDEKIKYELKRLVENKESKSSLSQFEDDCLSPIVVEPTKNKRKRRMTATSTPTTAKLACTRAVSVHGDSSLNKQIFRNKSLPPQDVDTIEIGTSNILGDDKRSVNSLDESIILHPQNQEGDEKNQKENTDDESVFVPSATSYDTVTTTRSLVKRRSNIEKKSDVPEMATSRKQLSIMTEQVAEADTCSVDKAIQTPSKQSTSDPLNEADKSPVDNTVQIETPSKLARLREVALRYLGLSPAIPVDAPTIPPQTADDPAPKAAVKEPPEDVPSKNCDSNVEASEKVLPKRRLQSIRTSI